MGPTSLRARSISRTIHQLLALPHRGRVLAAFERSCYVEVEGRIIALAARELLNGPLNILVDAGEEFRFPAFAGATVETSPHHLVAGSITVELDDAAIWNPELLHLEVRDRRRLLAHLDAIKEVLAAAPTESLAHAAQRPSRTSAGMDALYSALRTGNMHTAASACQLLAGSGAGLTPSGDDVLAGALVAVTLLRPPTINAYRRTVLDAARDRTTRISAAYLEAAAHGEAHETWHVLAADLGRESHQTVAASARRVMAFGETSGADMLTGFVLSMEALLGSSQSPQSSQSPPTRL